MPSVIQSHRINTNIYILAKHSASLSKAKKLLMANRRYFQPNAEDVGKSAGNKVNLAEVGVN